LREDIKLVNAENIYIREEGKKIVEINLKFIE
jgi:hypothetical protein